MIAKRSTLLQKGLSLRTFSQSLLGGRGGSKIVQGKDLRRHALKGAVSLSRAVERTLGPAGRNIVIDPNEKSNMNEFSIEQPPFITKDGVTVARSVSSLHGPR